MGKIQYISTDVEGDRSREGLKVRVKLVGGYWEAIQKAPAGCQVIETETDNLAEAVDDSSKPSKKPTYHITRVVC